MCVEYSMVNHVAIGRKRSVLHHGTPSPILHAVHDSEATALLLCQRVLLQLPFCLLTSSSEASVPHVNPRGSVGGTFPSSGFPILCSSPPSGAFYGSLSPRLTATWALVLARADALAGFPQAPACVGSLQNPRSNG